MVQRANSFDLRQSHKKGGEAGLFSSNPSLDHGLSIGWEGGGFGGVGKIIGWLGRFFPNKQGGGVNGANKGQ